MTDTIALCSCGHRASAHGAIFGCLHDGGACPCERLLASFAPVTPYAGSSGWSGSETSKERADRDDADGTTAGRQQITLERLRIYGTSGVTWKELAASTGWHHGQASGVLSVLHKAEKIARLTERRNRCQVYVLPEHVDGRETRAQGRTASRLTHEERAALTRTKDALYARDDLYAPDLRTLVAALDRLA